MNTVTTQSPTTQETAINTLKDAKLAIATMVSEPISRTEKREALGKIKELVFQLKLVTTGKEFYTLIPEENLELLREDLNQAFWEYHQETDFLKELLLKNLIKNNFRRIINNENTFHEYYEYFLEEQQTKHHQKICQDLENSLNQDWCEEPESDRTQNSDSEVTVEDSEDFPDDRFIVKNLIPARGLSFLVSHFHIDQQKLACEIAHSVVTDQSLFNHFPVKPAKVLLFSLKEEQQTTIQRFHSRGFSVSEEYSKNLVIKYNLSFNQAFDLEPYLQTYQPDLVIIDDMSKLLRKIPNATYKSMESLKYNVNHLLIKYNCAGVILFHLQYFSFKDLIKNSHNFDMLTKKCNACIVVERNDNELTLNAFGAEIPTQKYILSPNLEPDWDFMGIYQMQDYP